MGNAFVASPPFETGASRPPQGEVVVFRRLWLVSRHSLEPRDVGEGQLVVMDHNAAELGAAAELGEDLAGI